MTREYTSLCADLEALIKGFPHKTANLSNAAALIFERLGGVSWAGFYLIEGDTLVLGPFQGRPACIEIKPGRGVCGTAFSRRETVAVPDVREFRGHIACDERSRSEIVVPLIKDGVPVGVLDLDSTETGRFTSEDKEGLEAAAKIITENAF